MSRYPEKSELPPLLVTRPEFRFPLDNIVERPWIEPFTWGVRGGRGVADPFGPPGMAQCNRVQRPPPPPHLIAQSKKPSATHSQVSTRNDETNLGLPVDPVVRVRQLEKSLAFVKESHALILGSLHKEVEELKNKNRELQFQLIVGVNSPETSCTTKAVEDEQSSADLQKKIEKLEKEIRRLRNALRDSLQVNTQLSTQLQAFKIKNKTVEDLPAANKEDLPPRSHSALDLSDDIRPSTPGSGSPKIDEYSDSLQMIQQAATSARTKSSRPAMEIRRFDRQYNNGGANGRNHQDWGGQGGERGRRYSDYQPRLPRLALRNQQNYQQQGADSLPLLKKPLFPSLEHQSERTRKPRGQRSRPQGNVSQR